jgi:hypothetical protein
LQWRYRRIAKIQADIITASSGSARGGNRTGGCCNGGIEVDYARIGLYLSGQWEK